MIGQTYTRAQLNAGRFQKTRTYASFAGLGTCPWNPLDCFSDIRVAQAQQELAEAHNAVLAYANMTQAVLADAQSWPPSEQKDAVISQFAQMAQDAQGLVYEHTQVQNSFNHQVGLAGLGSYQGMMAPKNNGLGILPAILILIESIPAILTMAALASLGISIALAFKSHYEAQVASSAPWVEYYKSCADIIRAGGTCTTPPGTDIFGGIGLSMGTLAIIGIGVFLFMGMSRS